MQYLVTTKLDRLPDGAIAMIDGTVPDWVPEEGDLHFDHHRIGINSQSQEELQ